MVQKVVLVVGGSICFAFFPDLWLLHISCGRGLLGIFEMPHVCVGLDFSFPFILPSVTDNQTHMFIMEWKKGWRWMLSPLCVCVGVCVRVFERIKGQAADVWCMKYEVMQSQASRVYVKSLLLEEARRRKGNAVKVRKSLMNQ